MAAHLDLLLALAMRDVKARYQATILGLYWAIINPAATALIMGFVFEKVFRASGIAGVPFAVYVFSALIFWNLFANSAVTAATSLTGQASLLSKQYFPRIILPTAAVLARLVDLLFSLVALVIVFIIYGIRVDLNPTVLLACLVLEVVFALGFAYLVSALNVLYRDVSQILNLLLLLWMYFSPILYGLSQVPASARVYFEYNAIGRVVDLQRSAILVGSTVSLGDIGVNYISCFALLGIGYLVFKHIEPLIAEVM
jgi:ABC-type polysaccharide/polyol phosphate export permease